MLKYRQILPLLLLSVLTGCNGASWKPKWISRFRPGAEERRTANSETESENADSQKQFDSDSESAMENDDAELVAVERQSRLIRDAQTALRAENLEEARRLYREVLNEAPDHPDAHHGLAMAADLDEDWGDAEYHYKQALRIRPKDAVLLSDIGYSYVLQNRYAEATRYLNQAIELQPGYERAHMNLALLDLRQGNRTAAEQRLVQRLGNSAKTASILASLERQAFPDTTVAAAPKPQSRQPAPDLSLAEVQEIARKERALAEQRRYTAEPDPRAPQPWFPGNTPHSGIPASTVSGRPAPTYQLPPPAFASQSESPPAYPQQDPWANAESWPHAHNGSSAPYANTHFPVAPNPMPPAQGDPYSAHQGYPSAGYPSAGYPSADYSSADYPSTGYPGGGYPSPADPATGYQSARYSNQGDPNPDFHRFADPIPGYPNAGYPNAGYSNADYGPQRTAPPSYSTADPQLYGELSTDRSEGPDRPSGRLTLPDRSATVAPTAPRRAPEMSATAPTVSDGQTWSSNAGSGVTGVSVSPPVPIRSSSAGTTAGAESYGQPAGFNRSLPDRMRVFESGGGQSGFPVSGANTGFRTEGLNVGPGSLFPPVEPQRNPATPQRTIVPAGYADTNDRGGVVPAWGGAQRPRTANAAGAPSGGRGTAVAPADPDMWPGAVDGPGSPTADSGEPEGSMAPGPAESDRALQTYRDQLQQINSQFNRQPPPASYNDSRR
ncbi:MAG: tetratricopeptide repeat protein [Planctomycetota bacterium]